MSLQLACQPSCRSAARFAHAPKQASSPKSEDVRTTSTSYVPLSSDVPNGPTQRSMGNLGKAEHWYFNGFTRIPSSGPILKDHRIYLGLYLEPPYSYKELSGDHGITLDGEQLSPAGPRLRLRAPRGSAGLPGAAQDSASCCPDDFTEYFRGAK